MSPLAWRPIRLATASAIRAPGRIAHRWTQRLARIVQGDAGAEARIDVLGIDVPSPAFGPDGLPIHPCATCAGEGHCPTCHGDGCATAAADADGSWV